MSARLSWAWAWACLALLMPLVVSSAVEEQDVDYANLKQDHQGLIEFQQAIIDTLEAAIPTTADSLKNGTRVSRVKAVVTDVAVADPDWDDDDDEHDDSGDGDHHGSHSPSHRFPLDCASTVVVARASMQGVKDLLILKTFRVLLVNTPQLVWLGAFAAAYGAPECLVATVHVENSFVAADTLYERDSASLVPAESLLSASDCRSRNKTKALGASTMAASPVSLEDADWAWLALVGVALLLASAALSSVVLGAARGGPRTYAPLDGEDSLRNDSTERQALVRV